LPGFARLLRPVTDAMRPCFSPDTGLFLDLLCDLLSPVFYLFLPVNPCIFIFLSKSWPVRAVGARKGSPPAYPKIFQERIVTEGAQDVKEYIPIVARCPVRSVISSGEPKVSRASRNDVWFFIKLDHGQISFRLRSLRKKIDPG
jgi:hypothetical protein